jgi:Flp pilus assembly protein CpaB
MTDLGSFVAPEVGGNGGRPPVRGPRPLRRRRSLPGSRAVVGGFLVAAALVGLFAAYTRVEAGPSASYVVARHSLVVGTRLEASDLVLEPMDLSAGARARAFGQVADLVGTTLLSPLEKGELLQASSVAATPPGGAARVVSFPVERGRLGRIKQGERIDVVATYGTGTEAYTAVVLREALVTEIDRGESSLGDGESTVLTVAVDDPADELAMAHALQLAKLTVVVTSGSTAAGLRGPNAAGGPPVTYRSGVGEGRSRAP